MGVQLIQFQVVVLPKLRMIGKGIALVNGEISPEDRSIEILWEAMVQDGSLAKLAQLPGRVGPPGDLAGWMGDFYPPDMHFTYLAGALFQADAVAPEGFIYRDIEPGEMAISWLLSTEDAEGGSIHVDGSAASSQAMAAHGYEYDASRGMFEMEYQSYERYYAPLERGEQPMLDFYSPCKKKR